MRDHGLFSMDKNSVLTLFFICALSIFITGAEIKPDSPKNNLTFGMVKKNLIKGQTTQAEILNLFGAPNITTKNKTGEEVWSYDKISVTKEDMAAGLSIGGGGLGLGGGGVSGIGGGAGVGGSNSSTSSRSITLIITFDEKDIVKDYAVMAQEF
ncbi:MAG: hypothetical protein Q8O22_06585 [Candidatus Omnitrophota bacterium]|nr:hypothetical protein [Candidatus Omnitrophota bacterium]